MTRPSEAEVKPELRLPSWEVRRVLDAKRVAILDAEKSLAAAKRDFYRARDAMQAQCPHEEYAWNGMGSYGGNNWQCRDCGAYRE